MIGVNLTGAFLTVQAALSDVTRKGGGTRRIVFTASTAGLKGYPYVAAYCAAKHGVVGLARSLAVELMPAGVTVNAVCPGLPIRRFWTRRRLRLQTRPVRTVAEARANARQGQCRWPVDIHRTMSRQSVWLCSPAANAVNGEAIVIAGTWHDNRQRTKSRQPAPSREQATAAPVDPDFARRAGDEAEVRERLRVEFG
jgi:NAD(P)-dependent dehydrogenase (short-subunit alcohol dehydrogenase family)